MKQQIQPDYTANLIKVRLGEVAVYSEPIDACCRLVALPPTRRTSVSRRPITIGSSHDQPGKALGVVSSIN